MGINLNSKEAKAAMFLFGTAFVVFIALLFADDEGRFFRWLEGSLFVSDARHGAMLPGQEEKADKREYSLENADIAISLDHISFRILSPAIEEFMDKNRVKIAVFDGTCGNSIGLLYRRKIDIGGLCCPLAESDRIAGLRFYTLGITPVAAIVHPDNPLDEISFRELRKVYTGEIRHWSGISSPRSGMARERIAPVVRLHCKKRPGHWRVLLDREELFSTELVEIGTIPDVISFVSMTPEAIGFESLWLATGHYGDRWKVKPLKLDGRDPAELKHLASGNYPLYRVLSISLWEEDIAGKNMTYELVLFLMDYVERNGRKFEVVPSVELRKSGWKFRGDELVGEPA